MLMNIISSRNPQILMISHETVIIYLPLKSSKKWKRSSKTVSPWSWGILQDFHFHTERQLFYLPIELTQINLKVQTHTNAFLTRIYGSCLAEYPSIRRENIDEKNSLLETKQEIKLKKFSISHTPTGLRLPSQHNIQRQNSLMGICLFFNLITTSYDVRSRSLIQLWLGRSCCSIETNFCCTFDSSLPSPLSTVFDSQFCECLQLKSLRSQQNIFRNSLLKVRFIPAYIKGFIVFDR